MTLDTDEEKPLDPEVARVQRTLRRLMLIAALTLGVGMAAVFAGIAYRLITYEPSAPAAIAPGTAVPTIGRAEVGLGPAARIVSTALDGNRLALTFEEEGSETVLLVDLATGTVTGRFRIDGRAPAAPRP